jgi:hypothetical protein
LLLVLVCGFEVKVVLDRIDDGADDCADGEGELDEGCLESTKAVATGQSRFEQR